MDSRGVPRGIADIFAGIFVVCRQTTFAQHRCVFKDISYVVCKT